MKNKVYEIRTNCNADLTIQKSEVSITGANETIQKTDEICIVINDDENNTENECWLTKRQAIYLAKKLIEISNSIK